MNGNQNFRTPINIYNGIQTIHKQAPGQSYPSSQKDKSCLISSRKSQPISLLICTSHSRTPSPSSQFLLPTHHKSAITSPESTAIIASSGSTIVFHTSQDPTPDQENCDEYNRPVHREHGHAFIIPPLVPVFMWLKHPNADQEGSVALLRTRQLCWNKIKDISRVDCWGSRPGRYRFRGVIDWREAATVVIGRVVWCLVGVIDGWSEVYQDCELKEKFVVECAADQKFQPSEGWCFLGKWRWTRESFYMEIHK